MSWDINHVVIVGRLTRDPELTYTQSGAAVCRFSVAVNRSSGPRVEGQDEAASYFNVVAWNKTAELCKEYLSKGRQVGIDGRLQQRSWSGTDGVKRNSVEIVANNVQFFGPGGQRAQGAAQGAEPQQEIHPAQGTQQGGAQGGKPAASRGREQSAQDAGSENQDHDPFLSELDDDEIPF